MAVKSRRSAGPSVLVTGFMHESNGFCSVKSGEESFAVRTGDGLAAWMAASRDELRGAADVLRRHGCGVLPCVYAAGEVGGLIDPAFWEKYLESLASCLASSGEEVGGVVCVLHGSASVRGVADAQGQLAGILRDHFPDVPIVASFDLHASPSAQLLRSLDAVTAYRTAPHRDQRETGERAAGILIGLMGRGTRGNVAQIRLPLLLPGEFGQTERAALQSIMDRARRAERMTGALDISILQGYPWADNPCGAVSLAVSFESGMRREPMFRALGQLARELWAVRSELYGSVRLYSMEEALERVQARGRDEFLILCDTGDNPTAGAEEDRTDLLRLALERGVAGLCFFPIVDAAIAERCQGHKGEWLRLALGWSHGRGCAPAEVPVHVIDSGFDQEVGHFAFIGLEQVQVFVCARRVGVRSPQLPHRFGIDARSRDRVLVVKSGYLFPAWADVLEDGGMEGPLLVSSPGATALDLRLISNRYGAWAASVYPLHDSGDDAEFEWSCLPEGGS